MRHLITTKLYINSFIAVVLLFCNLAFAMDSKSTITQKHPAIAIFAGGCFWCMQPPYNKLPGVIKTVAGYTGGNVVNPTYKQVSSGKTGHYEAVAVYYDPHKVSYQKLLNVFWKNIDPTDAGGQFCDRGSSYRSAIFYTTSQQQALAIASKQALIKSHRVPRVVTPILPAKSFYPAEKYHQNYYKKHPILYKYYRYRCGRDQRLNKLWHSQH